MLYKEKKELNGLIFCIETEGPTEEQTYEAYVCRVERWEDLEDDVAIDEDNLFWIGSFDTIERARNFMDALPSGEQ